MKKNSHLPGEISEPIEDILGEVRSFSRSRRRQATLFACLAVLGLLTLLLRISPGPSSASAAPGKPFLTFVTPSSDSSSDLDELRVYLFGDEPLLVPTRENAATQGLPGSVVPDAVAGLVPRDLFDPFAPVINASRDSLMPPAFLPEITLRSPDDLLGETFWKLTETFGQKASRLSPLPSRGAAWRISLAGGLGSSGADSKAGQVIMRGEWAEIPGGPEFKDRRWDVALFMVLVNEVGLLGEPLLERGTGIPEIDLAVSLAVARDIPWAAVPPGYYRVTVAP